MKNETFWQSRRRDHQHHESLGRENRGHEKSPHISLFAFRTTTECVADAFLAKRTIVYFEALAFFSVPKKV